MTVQRYDMTTHYNRYACEDEVVKIESDSGDYVLFEDYDEAMCDAQNEFDTLKRDYDNLVKAIGELYRDSV